MKKTFLILSFIFALLYVMLDILLNKNLQPIEILYDPKPYKIKPQNLPIAKKNTNRLSIYDNFYSEKHLIMSDDVLQDAENPLHLGNTTSIDKIINHLVDASDLKDYNGIKIFLVNNHSLLTDFELNSTQNFKSYVLDLGLYQTRHKALERLQYLNQLYPDFKGLAYKINKIEVQKDILYNLLLHEILDFKVAVGICDKLEKDKHDCMIVQLPHSDL
jgi:hypothetical protein